jgi:hypothetical protein
MAQDINTRPSQTLRGRKLQPGGGELAPSLALPQPWAALRSRRAAAPTRPLFPVVWLLTGGDRRHEAF